MAEQTTDTGNDGTNTNGADGAGAAAGAGTGAKAVFTAEQQAYINDLMGKVRAEGKASAEATYKAQREAEDKKRAEADRIAKLQGEEKIRAEYEVKQRETETKLNEAIGMLREAEAKSELAASGISPDFVKAVTGSTAEETKKNVAELRALIDKEVAAKINATAAKGAPAQPNGAKGAGTEADQINDIIRKGMGLK